MLFVATTLKVMTQTNELTLTTNHTDQQDHPAVVMRGPDGSLYAIRDEVLELCRMNKDDAESAEMILQNHQAGCADAGSGDFSLETAAFQPMARVDGNLTPMALKLTSQSTIMCCWSSLCFED
jgi:hypothetical protein